ncbi:MAG: hypothetical protein ACRD50_17330, partial [Candidatus Acidiferrales bacterium]
MTRAKFTLGLLLMLPASIVGAGPLPGTSGTGDQSRITAAAASPEAAVQGTWSGTFRSKHSHIAPFTLTLVVNPTMHGHLINKSGLTSYCLLRDADLHVIVNGSNVALASTDEVGNTITFEGTIDKTARVLTLNYVTNGSASGKCE